ncbi:MAG: idi [Patescibacteria group bacterium]|jgi:isopentenyl-diphosphate delta-isomerase|nr:idi [Patescibacteria group bacterium]
MEEYVVLVNQSNLPLGRLLKSEVHTNATPLHRGFSLFLFNPKGELLIQQRSPTKKVWPSIWSNSCCGHPGPEEENREAASRRSDYELGITLDSMELIEVIPDYYYRTEKDGIVEHEICAILVGLCLQEPTPNPEEILTVKWMQWSQFLEAIKENQESYSPWCIEEAGILEKNPDFCHFYEENCKPLL